MRIFKIVTVTLTSLLTKATSLGTFVEFKTMYHKHYSPLENAWREAIFNENSNKIHRHNMYANIHGYTMAENQFMDLNPYEYRTLLGSRHHVISTNPRMARQSSVAEGAPNDNVSLDWRSHGVVTPVKNQGQCGSCWSFSAVEAIESAYAIKTGTLLVLSEQQLVSCSLENSGCGGGLMDTAFEYVERTGITTENQFPYTAENTKCLNNWTAVVNITGYHDVPGSNEVALQQAVRKQPVSVAIEADQSVFQFYSKGIISSGCGTALDHGVLLVGYGKENATDYWLVRNSWGTTWGDQGYVKLRRTNSTDSTGTCGIAMSASFPMV